MAARPRSAKPVRGITCATPVAKANAPAECPEGNERELGSGT